MKSCWPEFLDGEVQALAERFASDEIDDIIFESIDEPCPFITFKDGTDGFGVWGFIEIRNRRRFWRGGFWE